MIQIVKDTKGNAREILSPLLPSHLVFLPLSNIFFHQFLTNSPRETSLHMQSKEIVYFIPNLHSRWLQDVPLLCLYAIYIYIYIIWSFPSGTSCKESACQCRRHRRWEFDPCIRKILWRRIWKPTPVFLPGESHERGAWKAAVHGVAELDTAEWLSIAQNTIYAYICYMVCYIMWNILHIHYNYSMLCY